MYDGGVMLGTRLLSSVPVLRDCEGEKFCEKRACDRARFAVRTSQVCADYSCVEYGLTRHIRNEVFQDIGDLSLQPRRQG